MSKEQHSTRKLDCKISYLADYLGLRENTYEIGYEVNDLICRWYSDYQTNPRQAYFEIGHLRTEFLVNFQIPLDELTQDQIAMLKVRWVCYTNDEMLYGSVSFTSEKQDEIGRVDFDVEISGGIIEPIELNFFADQGWLQIK
jgi:hypothetical protein